jgi:hypothetical protein
MIIAEKKLMTRNFRLDEGARTAFADDSPLRRAQAHFASGRSIRDAIDPVHARLARRIASARPRVSRDDLMLIREAGARAGRVHGGGPLAGLASPGERA